MKKVTLAGLSLVITAIALSAGGALAQTPQPGPAPSIDQGDVFLAVCQKPENLDACIMYLAGYTNGALVQSVIDKQRPRYCIPPNVGRKDQLVAVTTWMRGHLEHVLEPTAAVVYKALIGAYPCR